MTRAAMHDAVQTSLPADVPALDGGMVQRWLLVSEWLDADGDRRVDVSVSPDARTWDLAGLAAWASRDLDLQMARSMEGDQ